MGSQTVCSPSFQELTCKLSGGLDGYSSANKFVKVAFYRKQQLISSPTQTFFKKHVEALLSHLEVYDFSDWLVSLRHFVTFELGPIGRNIPLFEKSLPGLEQGLLEIPCY